MGSTVKRFKQRCNVKAERVKPSLPVLIPPLLPLLRSMSIIMEEQIVRDYRVEMMRPIGHYVRQAGRRAGTGVLLLICAVT